MSREAEQEWLHLPEQSVDIVIREIITDASLYPSVIVQRTGIECYEIVSRIIIGEDICKIVIWTQI